MAESTPRLLAGRYELGELIGHGGMAEVHLGRDTRLGRTVAIKLLRSDLARDPMFQARFRREAQSAAALNHPSIVAVYDTGEDLATDPSGQPIKLPFIVMEYVEGSTLRDALHDGAALPIDEAIELTIGVLTALEYSHHAGIVHRDIKPANVMITQTGAIKVMDFGIARALADSGMTMTQTHAVIGTAQYLSPEQARGEKVDARSDLYSTGCLLYELLTGRPPFVGDSAVAVVFQHVQQDALPPSAYARDVPEVLDRITLKALAKDRDQRYSSAAEFRADLESAARGGLVSAPAAGAMAMAPGETRVSESAEAPRATSEPILPEQGQLPAAEQEADEEKSKSRKKLWITLGIIAGVLVIGLAVYFAAFGNNHKNAGPTTPTMVSVPQVTPGMTGQSAETALKGAHLTPKSGGSEASDTVPQGQVIRFDPKSGTKLKAKSTVYYYVSSGPGTVDVPANLVGMTESEAQQTLQDAGLAIAQPTYGNSPHIQKGLVISSNPAGGQPVPKRSTVTLVLSNGQTTVPDIVGKSKDDAEKALTDAGLQVGKITETKSDQAPGTVISQKTQPNSTVDQNTAIDFEIARGSDKINMPNVLGQTADSAKSQLKELGFTGNIAVQPGTSDQYPTPGDVYETNPTAKTPTDKDATITLYVSTGPNPSPTDSGGKGNG